MSQKKNPISLSDVEKAYAEPINPENPFERLAILMRYSIQEMNKFGDRVEVMDLEMIVDRSSRQQDEIMYSWFECPRCEEVNVPLRANYCPDCGQKLKW